MLENNGCTISSNLLTELSGKENAMLSYFILLKWNFGNIAQTAQCPKSANYKAFQMIV